MAETSQSKVESTILKTFPQEGIVAILNQEGQAVGAGILVGRHHIFTLAHIIETSFKSPIEDIELGERVICRFIFSPNQPAFATQIVEYALNSSADDPKENYAFLRLLGKPETALPVQLAKEREPFLPQVNCFGFPNGYSTWITARYTGVAGNKVLQLVPETTLASWAGMGGGPVFHPETKEVLGVILAVHTTNNMLLAIPSEIIEEIVDGLQRRSPIEWEKPLSDNKADRSPLLEKRIPINDNS